MSTGFTLIQKIGIWVIRVLFAITLHEVAHGWVAKRLGDPTAMMLGRLTLNPVRHVDPVGTVLLPALLLWIGGFAFGWAKPVPVTWRNLRRPRRDSALVALAGPGANLLMGLGWALVVRFAITWHESLGPLTQPLAYMGVAGVFVNVVLMVLNLLPLPPLDGGRVMASVLPPRAAARYARIEPYGLVILLALLVLGWLGKLLWPALAATLAPLSWLAGIGAERLIRAVGALL